jgi:Tol biopolymer transport system component
MKNSARIAIVFAAASLCFGQPQGQVAARELSAEANNKEAAEARAKRNAQQFQNQATVIAFYDHYGKRTGTVGERALYQDTILSPDGKRVAVTKVDLANESADLYVMDAATGAATRLTTSARTEFVMAPVWSPDGSRIAYVTIRKGQEGVYIRAANGQGAEELVYKNPGAFMNLSDWSSDGRFLTFAKSDLSGGTLFILPLEGGADRKAVEVFHSDLQMFAPQFSPDGRFLSYVVIDKANKAEVFVRPVGAAAGAGPWQISDGCMGGAYWRADGKALYYVARDRSLMVSEVSTAPSFTFTKPQVLFRPPGAVPDRIAFVSRDGERFLALPPPRGPQLQQITIFNREGQVAKKVGEPGQYSQPSFSPDAKRLLVSKGDLQAGRSDLWTIDIATGKETRITNDTLPKFNPMWWPDGTRIAYLSLRDGDFGVYRRAADGTGGEELLFRYTRGAGMALTDISRDGKFLICDSGGVVLVVPLTGADPLTRQAIEYMREEFDYEIARLSPDGKFIAYRSDEVQAERGEVYVRPFDASKPTSGDTKWRVSKDGVNAMLNWRGDGKEFFFRGLNLESNELDVMAVEVATSPAFKAGTPRLLFKLPGPQGGNLGNVSQDGQQFVFAINVAADRSAK